MKHQSATHGGSSTRWLGAAVIVIALALLSLSVIPKGVEKKAQPRAQSRISQPQIQTAVKSAPQLPNPAATKAPPRLQNQAAANASPAAGGMRIFIDPATGKIREPEAWEEQQLSPSQANASPVGLRASAMQMQPVMLYHDSGAVGTALGEDQMSYSVARVNSDGTLVTDCLPSRQAAAQWLRSNAGRPATERKEKLDEK